MRGLLLCSLVISLTTAGPQKISFGGSSGSSQGSSSSGNVNTRLGLLATQLGLDPTASQGGSSGGSNSQGGSSGSFNNQGGSSGNFNSQGGSSGGFSSSQGSSAPLIDGSTSSQTASGRIPSSGQQCCCVPRGQGCQDPFGGGDDLVGSGLIDPRLKNVTGGGNKNSLRSGISTRIVNRPVANTNSQQTTCPVGQETCCYDASIDLSVFGIQCLNPQSANTFVQWTQGCRENVGSSSKTCGTRQPSRVTGGEHGDSAPGEFPWTCLLLNQNNDFIGSCAVIPDDFSNNNNAPTRKVITAAHKLKNLQQNDLLKVRVGEWDASGFNAPEQFNHEEYTVVRILKHPQFNAGRLSNDIALLYTDRDINLNSPNVNTACLPSCDNMFDHQFANGTGVRCWVAGWGKDEIDGSFQFKQKKVSLPLVEDNRCNSNLKVALNNQRQGTGNRFQLHSSEVCAGGEIGKDACTGDGGSPLVCQSDTGRWTVVGLVTWGVGCGSDTPGVYAKVSTFRNWINAN